MVSRILAFRPPTVVDRLAPRSGACPLAAREVLGPASRLGLVIPFVEAPVAAVARGALVAAKELQAALGLAMPRGLPVARWFDAVTRAADEVAAGLPIVLAADVEIEGEGATDLERARADAWRLLDAGVTHLAVDVSAIAAAQRGRVLGDVAEGTADRGVSVEAVVSLADGALAGPRAAAMLEEAGRRGVTVDVAGVRCAAPSSDEEARVQAVALARVSQALAGVPVRRRGPATPRLLELLRGSPVKACDDGGAAAARALGITPSELRAPEGGGPGPSPLERAVAGLSEGGADRIEARAYVDTTDLVERLGARGSAAAVARDLERRLEER